MRDPSIIFYFGFLFARSDRPGVWKLTSTAGDHWKAHVNKGSDSFLITLPKQENKSRYQFALWPRVPPENQVAAAR